MSDDRELDLDLALGRLARAEADAAPGLRPELMARILGDAADVTEAVTAARAPAAAAPARPRAAAGARRRLGWFGGALAAISLSFGMGVGYAGVAPDEVISRLVGPEITDTGDVPARSDSFGGEAF